MQPKDALRARLTGEVASDVSDASATLLFDLRARTWAADICQKLGIDAGLLPPIMESETKAGSLRDDAARALGLPAGIAVAVGGADAPAAALGLGMAREKDAKGTVLISLGTGGQVLAPVAEPHVDPEGRLHGLAHVVPGQWCVMAAILSAAASLDWVVRLLRPDDPNGSRELLAAATKVPAGSDGLIFLPYLRGERTPHFDPSARGALVGMRISHGAPELTRAVLEGVAFALAEGLDLMRGVGVQPTSGVVAGGGVNRLWQQILADVLNLPVALGATEHGSARGAALLGAVAGGVIPSTANGVPPLPADTRVMEPDPANVRLYAGISATYRELYGRLPHAPKPSRRPPTRARDRRASGAQPRCPVALPALVHQRLDALLVHGADPLERGRRDRRQVGRRSVGPGLLRRLGPGNRGRHAVEHQDPAQGHLGHRGAGRDHGLAALRRRPDPSRSPRRRRSRPRRRPRHGGCRNDGLTRRRRSACSSCR